jgi:hypothetical protein
MATVYRVPVLTGWLRRCMVAGVDIQASPGGRMPSSNPVASVLRRVKARCPDSFGYGSIATALAEQGVQVDRTTVAKWFDEDAAHIRLTLRMVGPLGRVLNMTDDEKLALIDAAGPELSNTGNAEPDPSS